MGDSMGLMQNHGSAKRMRAKKGRVSHCIGSVASSKCGVVLHQSSYPTNHKLAGEFTVPAKVPLLQSSNGRLG